MVFNSVSSQPETIPEPDPTPDSMASTVPSKSLVHQAHNHGVPLPQLKWAISNNTTTTKSNENIKTSENNNPSLRLSSNTKLAQLDPVAKQPEPKSSNVEKETDPIPATGVIDGPETQKPKSTAEDKKSKICIRIRSKEKAAVVEPEAEPENEKESSVAALAALVDEETIQKTWNLRPRRPVPKANGRAGALKTGAPLVQQNKTQVAGDSSKAGAKGAEKKDNKLKISVSLTNEAIEEDIFIMTGARPSRRPKKRAKNVQKQLDHLFPGLWLNSVSTNSYQVPEAPLKRI